MALILNESALQPPAMSFTHLPFELRDIIYSLLIEEAIVQASTSLSDVPQRQSPSFSRTTKFDLHISTKGVTHPNLRLPSNLIYTCHQINTEMNTLICSHTHHLKVTGDFLMGLSSADAIFDILARRPWIANTTKTVNIVLKLDHVLSFFGGVAVNSSVLEQHPWLDKRLKTAELKVRKFEMATCGMTFKPHGFWQVLRARELGMNRCLEILRIKSEAPKKTSGEEQAKEAGHECNMLPDLAKHLETFSSLEKIDIETDHRHLLSLFSTLTETAESFRELNERRIEVNLLVKQWQMKSFCNMLYRNGLGNGSICYATGFGGGKVALFYETLPDQWHRIVSFRLVDCVLRQESEGTEDQKSRSKLWKHLVGPGFGGRRDKAMM